MGKHTESKFTLEAGKVIGGEKVGRGMAYVRLFPGTFLKCGLVGQDSPYKVQQGKTFLHQWTLQYIETRDYYTVYPPFTLMINYITV